MGRLERSKKKRENKFNIVKKFSPSSYYYLT